MTAQELSRTRVEAEGLAVDVVMSRQEDADGKPCVVLTLEGQGITMEGEMPGEYWLYPMSERDVANWALRCVRQSPTDERISDLLSLAENADVNVLEDKDAVAQLAEEHWPRDEGGE